MLLYVPCVSVMGAIARESSRGGMTFSILWGLNVAYSLAAVFYQVANLASHPQDSSFTMPAVVIFNARGVVALRRSRDRVTVRLVNDPASECCCDTGKGSCH